MIPKLPSLPFAAPALQNAILNELFGHDWSQPAQATLSELGLALATHPGMKRGRNEDRLAVARVFAPNLETYTVAIVCDGVGGSESGDRAAALAITNVVYHLAVQQGRPGLKDLASMLVRSADDYVRHELQGRGTTTLVMLIATAGGLMVCVGVGDSRVYSWDSKTAKIVQVTRDDTVENELKDIPGDHKALLQARGLQGRLSQAIGETGRSSDELRVQTFTREHFKAGAVLASDGLWRAAKDFEAVVANATTAADVVRRTISVANWVGGVDNSAVIAIEDPELFCRPPGAVPISSSEAGSITLWLGTTKVRIVVGDQRRMADPALSSSKVDKKKPAKAKHSRASVEEPQLKFESESSKEPRPLIEVTLGGLLPVS